MTNAYGPQQHDPYAAGKISAKTIKNNALRASFYYYARAKPLTCNEEVTLTLSKVAVLRALPLWAQLNRPMVTGSVIEIVAVPTWVQVVPSGEE